MEYQIETEKEADGRWIAEIAGLPGVLTYGVTEDDAMARAEALAISVIVERRIDAYEAGELRSVTLEELMERIKCHRNYNEQK